MIVDVASLKLLAEARKFPFEKLLMALEKIGRAHV